MVADMRLLQLATPVRRNAMTAFNGDEPGVQLRKQA
jgi:hypothetical protein